MSDSKQVYQTLLEAVLPSELFQYFEILKVSIVDKRIDVHLDELNIEPDNFQGHVVSKGFHGPIIVQDFPIRERSVFLHVRRRRWTVVSSGKIISRDWDTVAKGTRYTKGFASFLKGLFGQLPNQQ
jgi:hypothetical protein